jgi:hypothetical protein
LYATAETNFEFIRCNRNIRQLIIARLMVRREWQKLFGAPNSIGMVQTRRSDRSNAFALRDLSPLSKNLPEVRLRRGAEIMPKLFVNRHRLALDRPAGSEPHLN